MGNDESRPKYATPKTVTPEGVHVGAHSGFPDDPVPYAGSPLEYCFVNIEAKLKAKVQLSLARLIKTNIDEYYDVISQPYTHGFLMNQFQSIPGALKEKEFSLTSFKTFQAILSRPISAPPSQERWQLRVEKSFLETQTIIKFFSSSNTLSDTSDIHQKINALTSQGGRLVCVEMTGHHEGKEFSVLMSGTPGMQGVDLFFNMPLHPNPQIYVYQVISVPVKFKLKMSHIKVYPSDFIGQFNAFLERGWKLVEINFDCSETSKGFLSERSTLNSIWFFEKEESKMHGEVQEWEGTIVEYEHKWAVSYSGGTRAKTNWDSVVVEMGQRGWELACLVQSPESYIISMTPMKVAMKVLMFFQRKIMQAVGAVGCVTPPHPGQTPPQGNYPQSQKSYPPPQGSNPTPHESNRLPQGSTHPPEGSYPSPSQGSNPPPQGGYLPLQRSNPPARINSPSARGSNPSTNPTSQGSNPSTWESYSPPQGSYPPPQGGYLSPQGGYPSPQGSNYQPQGSCHPSTEGGYPPPRGVIPHPTGVIPHPRGVIHHPRGVIPHPRGVIPYPRGVILHPRRVIPRLIAPTPGRAFPAPSG
ncbi:uncharacterized protein LOC119744594 [Patiria miniata]|uniref:Uncharacterized protein n=1 Tax=Patiria miniata TaxID=46514 RepID=A0A914BJR5_PATMI|nr:uncharacterized protein LOC119744594 [Patiria miniata]